MKYNFQKGIYFVGFQFLEAACLIIPFNITNFILVILKLIFSKYSLSWWRILTLLHLWRWGLLKLLILIPGCHEELAGSVQEANHSQQHTFALNTSRERVLSSSRSAYSVHLGLYMLSFIMRIFNLFLVAGSPAEQWHAEKCSFGWTSKQGLDSPHVSSHCCYFYLLLFTSIVTCDTYRSPVWRS